MGGIPKNFTKYEFMKTKHDPRGSRAFKLFAALAFCRSRHFDSFTNRNSGTVFSRVLAVVAVAVVALAFAGPAAASLNSGFGSASDVPVTSDNYTASGNLTLGLGFAPAPGTNLTVVKNTGPAFISGRFDGVPQGGTVPLAYNGTTYNFIANYYGGNGRSLVLQWPNIGLAAWGQNLAGQLGNNSTSSNCTLPVPVDTSGVLAGKTVVATSAGGNHTLALTSNGTVFSWGSNSYGKLGNNIAPQSLVPVAVTGALAGKTVVAIAAGTNHSLALTSNGTVFAWGANIDGQLGNNSTVTSPVPVAVDASGVLAGKTVVAIAAGDKHSMALTSDGKVYAWGANLAGQLGNNSTVPSSLIPVAVATTGTPLEIIPVVAIDAGGSHSLALLADGHVFAWGSNSFTVAPNTYVVSGQLGNNSTTSNSTVPVPVDTSGNLYGKTVDAIAAGFNHSMALTSDGKVFAWGWNPAGVLGNNSTTSSKVPMAVDTGGVLYGKTVTAIAAGYYHSLAMTSDGKAYAWGSNSFGQLGNNSTVSNSTVPVAVNASGIVAGITAGYNHSLTMVGAGFADIAAGLPAVSASSVAWGDFDNDGRLDVLICGATSNGTPITRIYHNNPDGTFTAANADLPPVINGSVAWGDYNNDGGLDILISGQDSGGNPITQIYRNYGYGAFSRDTTADAALPQVMYSSVGWGDYDNDGRPDILISGQDSGGNPITGIFHNNADGTFTDISAGLPGLKNGSMAWGDYNNDGQPDILISGQDSGGNSTTHIYRNNGNGAFTRDTTADALLPQVMFSSVAWGDYNNDGSLDILISGQISGNRTAQIFRNNTTNGTFTRDSIADAALPQVMLSSVAWGDYDNDGRPDILISGQDSAGNLLARIYHNNADGTFADISAGLPGVKLGAVAWGDYDSDGRLDFLITGYGTSSPVASIYRSITKTANTVPSAPGTLSSAVNGRTVTLSWVAASDIQTTAAGLTYNVVVGTTPCGSDILSPQSDLATGLRRVAQPGNAGELLTKTLQNLPLGDFFWSVQAVDTAFAGSAFIQQGYFSILPVAPSVTANPTSKTAMPGGSVAFTAAASGDPAPTVQWYVSTMGANGSFSPVYGNPTATTTTLTLTNVTAAQNGYAYGAAFTNAAGGVATTPATLTVPQGPTVIASSTSVPFTADSVAVSGNLTLALGFAPPPGTNLTVVKNPGTAFINDRFSNVPQGGTVTLTFNGVTYNFIANYYGGNGRSLVLQWPAVGLYSWGANSNGQLGNNSTVGSPVPVAVRSSGVLAGKAVTTVAGGARHSLALTSNGTVYAWGSNAYGQVGAGSTNSIVPVAVTTSGALSGKTVVAVAGGDSHSLALASDGKVFSWGANFAGQLGNNSSTNSIAPVAVDTGGALAGKTVVSVAAGRGHNMALVSDGTVFAWGDNGAGQLGNNSTSSNSTVPVAVDASGVLAGKSVVAIAAGEQHSVALASNGKVYAWGANFAGQLGTSTTNSIVPVAVTTTGTPLDSIPVAAIGAGANHSMALLANGKVYAWGDNGAGQLGNNSTASNSAVPVAVTGILANKTVSSIAAGTSFSMALTSDGKAFAWGSNSNGQLGNNSTSSNSTVPVAVNTGGVLAANTGVALAGGGNQSLALFAPPLVNGSFETGDFSGWIVSGTSFPPPQVVKNFNSGWVATDGVYFATHGFSANTPGVIRIAQDIPVTASAARLAFDYRAGWDMTASSNSTQARTFAVTVQPGGGDNSTLNAVQLTAAPGTKNPDTGKLSGGVDLSAYAGTTIRICFDANIPEANTGPGLFELDNVRLLPSNTWTGTALPPDWNTPGNWDLGHVPTDREAALITAGNATLSSGVVAGRVELSSGTLNWSGGTMNGTMNVAPGSSLNIGHSPYNAKNLNGTINNSGTITWTASSSLTMGDGSQINNQGVFDAQNSLSIWSGGWSVTKPVFNNGGTLLISRDSGSVAIDGVTLANTGTIDIRTGMLSVFGNYTQSGLLDLSIGGTGALYGQLFVSGELTLSGTVRVNLINGFQPAVGQRFTPVTFGSLAGSGATVELPTLDNFVTFTKSYTATQLALDALRAPIDTWKLDRFGADAGNPEVAGMTADPDHDGLPNLLEYAFGCDPKNPDAAGISPSLNIDGSNWLQISFPCDAARTDLNYTVQSSTTLAPNSWTDIAKSTGGATTLPEGTKSTVSDTGTGQRTVTVTDSTAIPAGGKRFLRVKVSSP